MNASPVRYFLAIGLHPTHNLAVLAAVTAFGVWTVWTSPGELDSALGVLLFVQMFLASTGFLTRARRGHFDPIFTSAWGRLTVIAAHWITSVLPGLLAWTIVSTTAWMFGGQSAASALLGRRALAFLVVSVVAWTAGFALARGAAGALWTAGLVAALLHRTDLLGSPSAIGATSSALTLLRHALVVIACPFLLLGAHGPLAPTPVAVAACATAVLLLLVWRFAQRVDLYLRERT
jgi:hypothetical protein